MSPAHAAERLRVVLDTNIYIAAFALPKGRTAAIWEAARRNRYRLFVSPAIIREMANVLRSDFKWNDEQAAVRMVAHRWRALSCRALPYVSLLRIRTTTGFWNARRRAGPT